MKQRIHYLFFVCLTLSMIACTSTPPMSLHWEMGKNDVTPGVCELYYTITNLSDEPITNEGWTLYFNYMSLHPIYTEGDQILQTELQASYHSITPTADFQPLMPDSSRTFKLRFKGNVIRQTSRPEGFFLVKTPSIPLQGGRKGKPISIPCTYAPFTRPEQMKRGIVTWEKTPYAEGAYVYDYVEGILGKRREVKGERREILPLLPQPKQVVYTEGVCEVAKAEIITRTDANMVAEGYTMIITPEQITIEASGEAGVFYAQQTLQQWGEVIPCGTVTDYPDLHHRGIMLDVVRNYYPVDSIYRVLDIMAYHKLNVLHFHLTDDEAWRLEIPGLSQLTDIGSKRGYTTDESECLLPMYCGGWDPNAPTTANGYITRKKYIELLRYAGERHIRVIPEIDMPGHMRAAKKAMGNMLTDSAFNARVYKSAQNYTDNVIDVTKPYAVEFIDHVVTELVKMHEEAGQPLRILNIGGDEVPKGALTREEHQAFIDAVLEILNRYNLQPMGWEEITHFCKPESKAICYSWLNSNTKPLEMAEAGYPVILANANRLYFDFAYCNHHEEKGLNWGGYTDEYRSFDWEPLIHPNVIGMNAQLWGEVIRSFSQVEWQIYPKIYGLAERAWNNRSALTLSEYNHLVYEVFVPQLSASGRNFHIQQPGIKVVEVDNPQLQLDDSHVLVKMNKVMQGGEILYCLDDGEWRIYNNTTAVPSDTKIVKAKVRYLDKESNTTWLWLQDQHHVDATAQEKNTGATF
ncbi:MAG: family 20 glycosylhydrolase [Paludibacteraceae bacterium]|nr:family 20 glycosylhydrolase [Paludibacteraceae bacterium]